jgi:23S rRNA (uridine2552-2'-O)-methyltransferase
MSDMAAPTTGHQATDHVRIIALCEAALEIAEPLLAPGGSFLAKVRQGGTERALQTRHRMAFRQVRHAKPPASRKESPELYVIATGYRGHTEESS